MGTNSTNAYSLFQGKEWPHASIAVDVRLGPVMNASRPYRRDAASRDVQATGENFTMCEFVQSAVPHPTARARRGCRSAKAPTAVLRGGGTWWKASPLDSQSLGMLYKMASEQVFRLCLGQDSNRMPPRIKGRRRWAAQQTRVRVSAEARWCTCRAADSVRLQK